MGAAGDGDTRLYTGGRTSRHKEQPRGLETSYNHDSVASLSLALALHYQNGKETVHLEMQVCRRNQNNDHKRE
eukprot:5859800-Pyramimonas_sp.AAC.1